MTIDTGTSKPVSQKPHPIAMKHYRVGQGWNKQTLNGKSSMRKSIKLVITLIIVVHKGNGGKYLVIDYCALNKVAWKFIWPMPKVEDIFSQLNEAKHFSTLDLCKQDTTIFSWMNPQYPKQHSPHHLENLNTSKYLLDSAQAPAYFQELMTGVLTDFSFAITYLNDIIIFSRTAEEHINHIEHVFKKLQNGHLSMKLSKCHFFTKEIQYLRHILSITDIRPLPSKLKP